MGHKHGMPMELVGIGGDSCAIVDASRVGKVAANSPAVEVMTDLRRIAAATVDPDTSLAEAQQIMVLGECGLCSWSMLLAHDRAFITASDLMGERPLQLCNQRGPQDAGSDRARCDDANRCRSGGNAWRT